MENFYDEISHVNKETFEMLFPKTHVEGHNKQIILTDEISNRENKIDFTNKKEDTE